MSEPVDAPTVVVRRIVVGHDETWPRCRWCRCVWREGDVHGPTCCTVLEPDGTLVQYYRVWAGPWWPDGTLVPEHT